MVKPGRNEKHVKYVKKCEFLEIAGWGEIFADETYIFGKVENNFSQTQKYSNILKRGGNLK